MSACYTKDAMNALTLSATRRRKPIVILTGLSIEALSTKSFRPAKKFTRSFAPTLALGALVATAGASFILLAAGCIIPGVVCAAAATAALIPALAAAEKGGEA